MDYKKFLLNFPRATVIIESDNNMLFNKKVEEIIGFSNVEIPNLDAWFEATHPGEAAKFRAGYELQKQKGFRDLIVISITHKDGSTRYIEMSGRTTSDFDVWNMSDHTELYKSKNILSSIFDNLPDMIFLKEANGLRFTMINKAGEKLLGVKSENLIGKSDYDFFPKSQADFFTAKDRAVLESKEILEIPEEPINTPDGEHWLHTKKIPILDENGESKFLLGISEDITKRRISHGELEARKAQLINASRLSALGEMAGGIAHEINNPLAILHALILKLQSTSERGNLNPSDIKAISQQMISTIERVDSIVTGLRTVARDSSNDEFIDISLSKIIKDTLGLSQEKFKSHGIKVNVIDGHEQMHITCRPVQISQVLINLLNNAFYAVKDEQDPWIEIATNGKGNKIEISVINSGPKMKKEDEFRLFEPFFTTKPVGVGTGLGLSMSRGIIKNHNGEIYYDPEFPNTRFVIELPKSASRN